MFPFYFKNVNASFADKSIGEASVAPDLARWSAWQWGRTVIAITAFISAVAAV